MMKKLLVLLSLIILVSAFTGCSSNPAKVETNAEQFSEAVQVEAEGTGNLTKSYTNVGN